MTNDGFLNTPVLVPCVVSDRDVRSTERALMKLLVILDREVAWSPLEVGCATVGLVSVEMDDGYEVVSVRGGQERLRNEVVDCSGVSLSVSHQVHLEVALLVLGRDKDSASSHGLDVPQVAHEICREVRDLPPLL